MVLLLDPDARYCIICDNLTTHWSESLVPCHLEESEGMVFSNRSRVVLRSRLIQVIAFNFSLPLVIAHG